jgi:hypothetical protein
MEIPQSGEMLGVDAESLGRWLFRKIMKDDRLVASILKEWNGR